MTRADRRRRRPADPRARWAVRLALAAPLVALGVWADRRGFVATGHGLFLEQAARVAQGGADLDGLGSAYPPVPVLLAGVLPGGALALSVVAALFAGVTLHLTGEQLLRRGFGWPVVAGLVLPVFAVPAVAFAASQGMAAIASLSLLAVALQGFVWFVVDGDTDAGFVCGLALAATFFVDPIAVFYALALGLAAWFFATDRLRAAPSAAPATVAVMVFPTVFVALAWAFLEWRFTGQALSLVATNPDLFMFPAGVLGGLGAALTVGAALLHVPLFLAVALVYAVRTPVALVGYAVSVLASVLAVWVGLRFTPVTAYVLFTLVALMSIPRRGGRGLSRALAAVGVVQLVLAWVWPPTSPGFEQWLAVVLP